MTKYMYKNRVAFYLREFKLSPYQASVRAGLARNTVIKLARGESQQRIDADVTGKLAALFGVPAENIFWLEEISEIESATTR